MLTFAHVSKMGILYKKFFIQDTHFGDKCKQCKTVQFPQNVASELGLHYLLTGI